MTHKFFFYPLVIASIVFLIPEFTNTQNNPFVAQRTHSVADSLRAAILKNRLDNEEWLKSDPTSYLAAVARADFGEKSRWHHHRR